jgi:hypothetical protein
MMIHANPQNTVSFASSRIAAAPCLGDYARRR